MSREARGTALATSHRPPGESELLSQEAQSKPERKPSQALGASRIRGTRWLLSKAAPGENRCVRRGSPSSGGRPDANGSIAAPNHRGRVDPRFKSLARRAPMQDTVSYHWHRDRPPGRAIVGVRTFMSPGSVRFKTAPRSRRFRVSLDGRVNVGQSDPPGEPAAGSCGSSRSEFAPSRQYDLSQSSRCFSPGELPEKP